MKDEGQSFEELLAQSRGLDEEDHEFWNIIWLLSERGNRQTFDYVFPLTNGDAFERAFSAHVLGRFGLKVGSTERPFSDEIIEHLLEMLASEADEDVMAALVSAVGHQTEDARIPLALRGLATHPTEGLRWNLALTLSHYETPESIEMLLQLMRDESSDVRDWATFGIGNQLEVDTTEIRAALAERLDDEDEDTRAEAIFGLAKRKDKRAATAVLKEFSAGCFGALLFQSLTETPDYRLLPALREMAQNPKFPEDDPDIQAAIAACEAHLEEQNEN